MATGVRTSFSGTPVGTSRAVPGGSPRGLGWPAPTYTITHSAQSCACPAARVHSLSVVTNHTGVGAWGRGRRGSRHATSALGSEYSPALLTGWVPGAKPRTTGPGHCQ